LQQQNGTVTNETTNIFTETDDVDNKKF
ncbi:large conductance mechanosensitive channel protein MscL, partial [Staphylococcus carnosus]